MQIIEKENKNLIIFHEHKLELLKESAYLVDYHLGKTNEIIKGYEKTVQLNLINGNLPLNEDKLERSNFMDDSSHIGYSKIIIFYIFFHFIERLDRKYNDSYKNKSSKSLKDSFANENISVSKFSKKKKSNILYKEN
jgi:hypothetical protein